MYHPLSWNHQLPQDFPPFSLLAWPPLLSLCPLRKHSLGFLNWEPYIPNVITLKSPKILYKPSRQSVHSFISAWDQLQPEAYKKKSLNASDPILLYTLSTLSSQHKTGFKIIQVSQQILLEVILSHSHFSIVTLHQFLIIPTILGQVTLETSRSE